MSQQPIKARDITIGPLREEDLAAADHIFHIAFGTFLGLPDPAQFGAGANYIHTRWTADPAAAFAATLDGKVIGSNFATNWGSVSFFGPLTIHPDYWDRGVGKQLMEPIMKLFARWGTRHAGLFTFAQSQKHVGLYQRFGFWPRFLTAIMSKPVGRPAESNSILFSQLSASEQAEALDASSALTNEVYDGLNVEREILSVAKQSLGDTLLLWDDSQLKALAVCHCGSGTEAGPETCYVKFAAARPGSKASADFKELLLATESLAATRGLPRLVAGVNTARIEAYQQILAHGFKTDFQGVAMHQDNDPGYSRSGMYIIDDWR